MSRFGRGGFLTLVAFLAAISICRAQEARHTKDSPEAVKKAVQQKKALLVDVREKAEWDGGHIEGAVSLPLSVLRSDVDPQMLARLLPKDKIIYLHCASGRRCLFAADLLDGRGYDLRALKQGYKELLKKGFAKAKQ